MIISKTPLRVSFVGGGTDFKEYYRHSYGAVVSTAIDKHVYVAVHPWFSPHIRVSYSKGEIAETVDDVEHHIIREALRLAGVNGGLEISYWGDVPIGSSGTGLGASSALTVGMLNALYALKGERVPVERLANEAYKIEREILNHPGGKQDHYAAAHGGFNYFRFNKDNTVMVEPIAIDKETIKLLDEDLLLFYTGMPTQSSQVSSEQKTRIDKNRSLLDEMTAFADEAKKILLKKDFRGFGELLHRNWLHKKKLADKVSNDQIDDYYERAITAGAVGGKISGAGGGGFLLFYCEKENQNELRETLADLKELPFSFEPKGSRIIKVDR